MNQETKSRLLGVLKQLEEGDKVEVETRYKSRTLTVTTGCYYSEREPYRANAHVVNLEGYGTNYHLDVRDRERGPTATLHYPSSDAFGEPVEDIRPKGWDFAITSDVTAEDLGISPR